MARIIQGRPDPGFDEWLLQTPLAAINGKNWTRAFAYSARDIPASVATWPARVGETLTKVASPSLVKILGSGQPQLVVSGAFIASTAGLNLPGALQDYIIEGLYRAPMGSAHSAQQTYMSGNNSAHSVWFSVEYSGVAESAPVFGHYHIQTANRHVTSANLAITNTYGLQHVVVSCNRDEASANGCRTIINGALSGTGVDFSANANDDLSAGDKPLSLSGLWDAATSPSQLGGMLICQAWYCTDGIAAGAAGQNEVAAVAALRKEMRVA